MKTLLFLFTLLLVGCAKPPIVTHHCDLNVDGVCFDRTDGQGRVIPMTKEDSVKVSRAIEERPCQP